MMPLYMLNFCIMKLKLHSIHSNNTKFEFGCNALNIVRDFQENKEQNNKGFLTEEEKHIYIE